MNVFLYLEKIYKSQFSMSNFIKLKPLGDIRSMKIHDLLYRKLFYPCEEKCDRSYCKMAKSSITNEGFFFRLFVSF
jgi:hypothetical protein